MMLTITKTTIIPPKMAGVVLLHCVAVPHVHMGISGDVADVVGKVAGDCVTTTPVKKNELQL